MVDILIVFLLAVINGLFSMAEIAIVSARRARLQQMVDNGSAGAQTAIELAENPNRFLSSVQIGITLIGIVSGTFGGAAVTEDLAALIHQIPLLAPYSKTIALVLVVALITYLSLVIGELVPKRIGLRSPEQIAAFVAPPMRLISRLTAPLIDFLSLSTELLLRLLRVRDSNEPSVSAAEVRALMNEGREEGVFPLATQEMVSNVFRLDELRVSSSMTPRTEIVWLDIESADEVMRQTLVEHQYTAFPVCGGTPDNVIGVVRSKDLLRRYLGAESIEMRAMLRDTLFVPESVTATRALDMLRQSKAHLALVIGEHGDVRGLVTIRDLIEEVVGDVGEQMATQRDDGSWLIDGLMPIDELKALLDLDELPKEQDYETVGGFIMAQVGHIPRAGVSFVWGEFRFEVVDMDGKRVDKVLAQKVT
jgi:putative hemolysin